MSNDKVRIGVVIGTTRASRNSKAISNWVLSHIEADERFEATVLDLAEINLPLFDEANHPRMQRYEHEHTKAWSQQVAAQDAFVFVTAEYNHSIPAALKNALDYLFVEWSNKPAVILSYGGISAGIRAAEHLKAVVSNLGMHATANAIMLPFPFSRIDGDNFPGNDIENDSEGRALDEVVKWDGVLRPLRA